LNGTNNSDIVNTSLMYWSSGGNGVLKTSPKFVYINNSSYADITISYMDRVPEASKNIYTTGICEYSIDDSGYSHSDLRIGMNDVLDGCYIKLDNSTITNITKHELGHALGLSHTDNDSDIMYYMTKQSYDTFSFVSVYVLLLIVHIILGLIGACILAFMVYGTFQKRG
jgi:predicted Zn-dependent protease